MTEKALHGLAMQALNMAKRDLQQKRWDSFLLASYYDGEPLHRMRKVERQINEKFGEDWLNNGAAKDAVFGVLRFLIKAVPPDGLVIVTASNRFAPTEKLKAMGEEAMEELANASHDRHHQAAREGLLEVQDSFTAVAQTPEMVCVCWQRCFRGLLVGQPEIHTMPQEQFDGRLKMFGEGQHTVPDFDPGWTIQ